MCSWIVAHRQAIRPPARIALLSGGLDLGGVKARPETDGAWLCSETARGACAICAEAALVRSPLCRCLQMNGAPDSRIQLLKDAPIRHDGEFVLYWMTAARRTHYNFGLQHAILKAAELRKPLVVVEHLPCGSGWDSERHHQFMLGGMADNARHLSRASFTYYPYLERKGGEAVALVAALADLACMVVVDYFPQTDWLRP